MQVFSKCSHSFSSAIFCHTNSLLVDYVKIWSWNIPPKYCVKICEGQMFFFFVRVQPNIIQELTLKAVSFPPKVLARHCDALDQKLYFLSFPVKKLCSTLGRHQADIYCFSTVRRKEVVVAIPVHRELTASTLAMSHAPNFVVWMSSQR